MLPSVDMRFVRIPGGRCHHSRREGPEPVRQVMKHVASSHRALAFLVLVLAAAASACDAAPANLPGPTTMHTVVASVVEASPQGLVPVAGDHLLQLAVSGGLLQHRGQCALADANGRLETTPEVLAPPLLCRDNGRRLDFHARIWLDETIHDDDGHRRKVPADDLAIRAADLGAMAQILIAVGDVPR